MNIKELNTQTIMAYAEMVTKVHDELNQAGGELTLCCSYGGITEKEKEEMHIELASKMDEVEEARITLVKEINSRLKETMGLSFGPSDVQPLMNEYMKRHPLIGKDKTEISRFLRKQKKEKKEQLAKV